MSNKELNNVILESIVNTKDIETIKETYESHLTRLCLCYKAYNKPIEELWDYNIESLIKEIRYLYKVIYPAVSYKKFIINFSTNLIMEACRCDLDSSFILSFNREKYKSKLLELDLD